MTTWVTVTAGQVAEAAVVDPERPEPEDVAGLDVMREVDAAVVDTGEVVSGKDDESTISYNEMHQGPPQIVAGSPPQAWLQDVLDVLYANVFETKHWYAFSNPNHRNPPDNATAAHLGIVISYVANDV